MLLREVCQHHVYNQAKYLTVRLFLYVRFYLEGRGPKSPAVFGEFLHYSFIVSILILNATKLIIKGEFLPYKSLW